MGYNTIVLKGKDFSNGIHNNIQISQNNNLILKDGETKGFFESEIINTIGFKDLVASWNGHTTENSSIELQIKIKKNNNWSEWFTYGKWSDKGYNKGSISNQKDDIVKVLVDVIKTQSGEKAANLKYKIVLERSDINIESPNIRLVVFTFTPYEKVIHDEFKSCEIDINVPQRSQRIVPEIGSVICSPTSLSMIMEYLGVNEETIAVAKGVKDNGAGVYGNWAYNVAYAGERGFESYVRRCESINDIKKILLEGTPVAASIKTNSQEELDGSFCAHKYGHLLVIRGFTEKDGLDYVIVNDPAAPDNEKVRQEYKLDQFNKVWSKIIYVVKK